MKKNKKIYFTGLLAIVFSLFLLTSCQPEFEADIYKYPAITIDAVSPASGYPGTIVTITGSNFGKNKEAAHISFNGVIATEFRSYEDGVMEVVVPLLAKSGNLSVQVWTDVHDAVASYTVIPLPKIQSMVSTSALGENLALPGDMLIFTGSGFGTDASAFSVVFGGEVEGEIISIQDDEMTVKAPEGFATGDIKLLLDGGATVIAEPTIINPDAPGDITPYFFAGTGDPVLGGGFPRGDNVGGRFGTLGEPWISNAAALNKAGVGGWAEEAWNGNKGYLNWETWNNTPVVEGIIYQPSKLALPAGTYTVSLSVYSEIHQDSHAYCVVNAGRNGIPQSANLGTALGYGELYNGAEIGKTTPSLDEVKSFDFTLETSQVVSLGFLGNLKGGDNPGNYFYVKWIKVVKK
nr:DUF5013 domain-containing protein [uncultured Flavobacterium sp.]